MYLPGEKSEFSITKKLKIKVPPYVESLGKIDDASIKFS